MRKAITSIITIILSCAAYAQQALQPGTYYIQNVANGEFLSSGAMWGTRAVLAKHGLDFRVTLSNGKYTLYTQIGGSSTALRPSDCYLDQSGTWTITPLADGTYAMSNGTYYLGYLPTDEHPWVASINYYEDSNSENTHWRFLTKSQLEQQLRYASADNPIDATFFIQAPDFLYKDYRISSSKVWGNDLTSTSGHSSETNYVLNASNAQQYQVSGYNITQTLTGLPNGYYTMSLQGFYRYGKRSDAASAHNNRTERLLAIAYAGPKQTPLPSIFSESKTSATGGWKTSSTAGYVPESQGDASTCFDSGAYLTTLTGIVVADGKLTVGIRKDTEVVPEDWACFDNFTLIYYGADFASLQPAAIAQIEDYAKLNPAADPVYEASLADIKADLQKATTATEVYNAVNAAQKAYDFLVLKTNIQEEWNTLQGIAEQATEHSDFDKMHQQLLSELPSLASETEIEAKTKELRQTLAALLKNGTPKAGVFDLTNLITNHSFDTSANGWQTRNTLSWNTRGLVQDQSHSAFNISQTLTEMPAGTYTLKVQAFYRSTNINESITAYENNSEVVRAELFLGNSSKKIMSIHDDGRSVSYHPTSDVAGAFGRNVPSSFNGVADAFEAGAYWNVLRTEVTQEGNLSLGLRATDNLSNAWMPFDNFRLYYGNYVPDIDLNTTAVFELEEDTYANVKSNIKLSANALNGICLPFDLPLSTFESVWTVGGIAYDNEGKVLQTTLVPATEFKAGEPYFVCVSEDMTVAADNVLVRALRPDSVPVIWEGGAMQGFYGRPTRIRTYQAGTSREELSCRTAIPAYGAVINLAPELSKNIGRPMSVKPVDFDDMNITINLENLQARGLLRDADYSSTSSTSIVTKYNVTPPGRRDQPHTAIIPMPKLDYTPTRLYARYGLKADLSDATAQVCDIHARQVEIANLVPGRTYYFAIQTTRGVVAKGQVNTEGQLRMIKVPSGNNVRDLGGWPTADGKRIRYEHIYRGGEMNAEHVMNQTDLQELRRLNISAEVDLRRDSDFPGAVTTSSALGTDVNYIYVNQDYYGADALRDYTDKYYNVFNFILKNLKEERSIYFHCIAGADRTGALAFLLEGLLGVSRSNLCKDYELTTFSIFGSREKQNLDSKFEFIEALEGNTLQEKFFNYWNKNVGIPASDLQEFITIMTESLTDGITEISRDNASSLTDMSDKVRIYDLLGRAVSPKTPGIYIKDNRKVLIR